jgi:hypothetical protein
LKEQTKTEQYIKLVQSWNKTHNLVSKTQANKLNEHIEDSLSVFEDVGKDSLGGRLLIPCCAVYLAREIKSFCAFGFEAVF